MTLDYAAEAGRGVSHIHRLFQVSTAAAVPENALVFRRMTGSEQLGRLYEYELELLSEEPDLSLESMLGEKFTISMDTRVGAARYYTGYATRLSAVGTLGRYWVYRATLRPQLWQLTRTSRSRIFEKQTVRDIIAMVFREHGLVVDDRLTGNFDRWEFRVQYRETDFNFVSRLMEEEGIYYFFTHASGGQKLVLSDSTSGFEDIGSVPYFPPDPGGGRAQDHISDWAVTHEVQPGEYTSRDFDWTTMQEIVGKSSAPNQRTNAWSGGKVVDYTTALLMEGENTAQRRGDPSKYARTRIEELQAQCQEAHGGGDLANINAGVMFKLADFPREDQNGEYAVTGCRFELVDNEYETGISDDDSPPYSCSFTAIRKEDEFRAPRITPKAIVQGPQTAIVTHGAGESAGSGPDEYGRVKIRFAWEDAQLASCWVRVSQAWAGNGWGAMAIPRVNDEVIVDFLEGDPDRPIITGRVYNGKNVVPYALPEHSTRTTFKSRSVGGDGFNEWRFEDKAGEEEFYFHAQKDMNTKILNNDTVDVGGDQKIDVTKTITITAGQQIELKSGASSILLKSDGTIQVKGVQVTVEGTMTTVKGSAKATVEGSGTLELKGGAAVTVQGGMVKIN